MLNVGIDFGSTYTIASVYREDVGKLEPVILGTGTPYIPSVVASEDGRLDGELMFGQEAKSSADDEDMVIYKAFKMLLAEQDDKILRERGYTKEVTPIKVTEAFLQNLVKKVCSHFGQTQIDHLVIGAPEIWFKKVDTISGRGILKEICSRIPEVDSVQVVSEPAAACAFFAYNYHLITKKPYEGNILLIDYGGGTLDISLAQVGSYPSDGGSHQMEIKVIEQNGAGENQDGKIGKAGIVYMESVVMEAIRRAQGKDAAADIPVDNDFYLAVDKLELKLQEGKTKIDAMFEDNGTYDPEELQDRFALVKYAGMKLEITYALLLEVYNKVIRNTFQEKLDEMKSFMEQHGIDYNGAGNEAFKIALVGGFGNYYLVRNQVQETFRFSNNDIRQKDIIVNQTDCENAISLGTALLSAGIIGIRQTAPYSIGLLQYDIEGKIVLDYAIRYKQDVVPNHMYFHSGTDGKPTRFFISENKIDNIILNSEHDDRHAMILPLKKEFRDRLSNLVSKGMPIAAIGFSLDESEILTIWVQEYSGFHKALPPKSIPLGRFDDMFVTSKLVRVVDMKG